VLLMLCLLDIDGYIMSKESGFIFVCVFCGLLSQWQASCPVVLLGLGTLLF